MSMWTPPFPTDYHEHYVTIIPPPPMPKAHTVRPHTVRPHTVVQS